MLACDVGCNYWFTRGLIYIHTYTFLSECHGLIVRVLFLKTIKELEFHALSVQQGKAILVTVR